MAKNKTFEKALNDVFADYEKALTKAMNDASNKALKDIFEYSRSCLEEYYDNYQPNSYDRTYSLLDAFVPYLDIKIDKKGITSTVGVNFDWSRLNYEASYRYRSGLGGDNALPTNQWVMENFLKGVHPATDGSQIPGNAFYYEIVDSESTSDKMDKYLDKYYDTFRTSVLTSFVKQAKAIMK